MRGTSNSNSPSTSHSVVVVAVRQDPRTTNYLHCQAQGRLCASCECPRHRIVSCRPCSSERRTKPSIHPVLQMVEMVEAPWVGRSVCRYRAPSLTADGGPPGLQQFGRGGAKPVRFDSIEEVKQGGFQGFVPISALQESACSEVPRERGVYLILRLGKARRTFLYESIGGRFKGKDPTVTVDELAERWVDGSAVLYIGQAGGSGSRLPYGVASSSTCNSARASRWDTRAGGTSGS